MWTPGIHALVIYHRDDYHKDDDNKCQAEGRRPLRRSASSSQEPIHLVRSLSEVACCPLKALMFLLLHAGLRGFGIMWAGVQESRWEGV